MMEDTCMSKEYIKTTEANKFEAFRELYNRVTSCIIKKEIGCGGTTSAVKKVGKINIICEPIRRIGIDKSQLKSANPNIGLADDSTHIIEISGGIGRNLGKLKRFYSEFINSKTRHFESYTIFTCYHSLINLCRDLDRNGLLHAGYVRFVFDESHKIAPIDKSLGIGNLRNFIYDLCDKFECVAISGSNTHDSIMSDIFHKEYVFQVVDKKLPNINVVDVTSRKSGVSSNYMIAKFLHSQITGSSSMYVFQIRDGISIIRQMKQRGSTKDFHFFVSDSSVKSTQESNQDLSGNIHGIGEYSKFQFDENSVVLFNSSAEIGVDFVYPFKHIFIASNHTSQSIFSPEELLQIAGRHRNSTQELTVMVSTKFLTRETLVYLNPDDVQKGVEYMYKATDICANAFKVIARFVYRRKSDGQVIIDRAGILENNLRYLRVEGLRTKGIETYIEEIRNSKLFSGISSIKVAECRSMNFSHATADSQTLQLIELYPTKAKWRVDKELAKTDISKVNFISLRSKKINKSWYIFLLSLNNNLVRKYGGCLISHKLVQEFIFENNCKLNVTGDMYNDLELKLTNYLTEKLSKKTL